MTENRIPDLRYFDRLDASIRPSWSANRDYLNPEHREVFEKTKDIPGWQMEGDSYKLYELGYFAGDVILEVGVYGGRSAVVELRGALSNPARREKPQFYGIDLDPAAIPRSYESLEANGLAEYALLYYGDVRGFIGEFCIHPTMVFVDGDHRYEGVRADLDALSEMLSPGIPVLCHDYLNKENENGDYGVRRAATEWEESGYVEFIGVFGCSALYLTTDKCCEPYSQLTFEQFSSRRESLLRMYGILESPDGQMEALQARIEELTRQLQASEADRAARLEVITQYAVQVQTIEADRAARLEVINQLAAQIREIEADRAARLEVITQYAVQVQTIEADRAARLEAINQLAAQIREIEADRAARLEVINRFSTELQQSERERVALWEANRALREAVTRLSSSRGAARQMLANAARRAGINDLLKRLLR